MGQRQPKGTRMSLFGVRVLLPAMLGAAALFAQEQPAQPAPPLGSQIEDEANPAVSATTQAAEPPGGNRVFGVLPNYRTADASQEGTVLTPRQKLRIASQDSRSEEHTSELQSRQYLVCR